MVLLGRSPSWRWLQETAGLGAFFTPGWWGVRIFFALSGYLIGGQVIQALSAGGLQAALFFGLRRWIRTIPTYWMILGLFCLWQGLSWFSPSALINALFLQSALPRQDTPKVIDVAWSLVVEEWSYGFLVLLLLVTAGLGLRTSPRQAARLLLAVVIAITGLSILIRVGAAGSDWMSWESLKKTATLQLDSLAAGIALACLEVLRPQAFEQFCQRPVWMGSLAVVGMSLLGCWVNSGFRSGAQPTTAAWALLGGAGYPLSSLLCCVFLIALWQVRLSAWPALLLHPIRLLANISYSLYLVHLPIATAIASHWSEMNGWGAFGLYALASIALGTVSWWLFEKPFLGIRRQLRRRSV